MYFMKTYLSIGEKDIVIELNMSSNFPVSIYMFSPSELNNGAPYGVGFTGP